tara:strand:+ start:354 stop:503 length:150 start_codon:yes stop_codon:yes gene_type:complete
MVAISFTIDISLLRIGGEMPSTSTNRVFHLKTQDLLINTGQLSLTKWLK